MDIEFRQADGIRDKWANFVSTYIKRVFVGAGVVAITERRYRVIVSFDKFNAIGFSV